MGGGSQTLRSVAYYVNWAIYARGFDPQALQFRNLTHVLYAFANLSKDTGTVSLTDPWSDTDKHYPTDSWNDVGTNVYGCIKQLYLLKKQNRHLKVLLSVGGWTFSPNFRGPATSTDAGRQEFARSVVQLVEDCGFDGVDIDWEYPENDSEAQDYVKLLAATRDALDKAAAKRSTGRVRFELAVAVPAGRANYEHLRVKEMDRYLDFWDLMAYDYSGSWAQTAGHQANLFASATDPNATPADSESAVNFYCKGGADAGKIVLGMPLYGRAFENTEGPGQPFTGVGEGSWEKGVWDYKVLPKAGAVENNDRHGKGGVGASWSYDATTKEMISYDTPKIARTKADFVRERRLGGGMWWESSGDKVGEGSLVKAFVNELGGRQALDKRRNCLEYPTSKYDNLKNNFPGEGEKSNVSAEGEDVNESES